MPLITLTDQETEIRPSDVYDDTVVPTVGNYETNPANAQDNFNHLRSQQNNLLNRSGAGFPTENWYDDIVAPSTLEAGSQRGINALGDALHLVEKKRILRNVHSLVDVTVGNGDNFVILGAGELPSQTTASVGTTNTLGTIVAPHGGVFGTHDLAEVAGPSAISPDNLMVIVDGATRDPILSNGAVVYGLLQGESGVVDGATITDTTTTRVQVSFVRINATGDDLEAVPIVDIEDAVINYCTREQVRYEDLNRADFLNGAIIDVPTGTTVTRQIGYDAQGTTPVNLATNSTLDLEGPGIAWSVRDDLEANLLRIIEGSAGGTSEIEFGSDVDVFDNDAAVNDFAAGATIRSGGTRPLQLGIADGEIGTSAGDMMLRAAGELLLDDVNQTGSTWAQDGIKLSETTGEWDAFETAFGETSLLDAIVQAAAGSTTRQIARATVTANTAAAVNLENGTNLSNVLVDYSAMDFEADVDIYLNGKLLWPDSTALAEDVNPGDTPADGDLKINSKVKNGWVIQMITWG